MAGVAGVAAMTSLRRNWIGLALLVAGSVPVPVRAADAMMAFDDYNIRKSIILRCHMTQSAADIAFLAKEGAIRRAASEQLRKQLDAADPARRDENAKKADDTLARQSSARDFDISEQARNYGCGWLDGQVFSSGR
jgi:hypothetical protein